MRPAPLQPVLPADRGHVGTPAPRWQFHGDLPLLKGYREGRALRCAVLAGGVVCALAAIAPAGEEAPAASDGASAGQFMTDPDDPVDFERAVAPTLIRHCTTCHDHSQRRGGLSLLSAEDLAAGGDSGPAVVPGDPEGSHLVERISAGEMPPAEHGDPLSPGEIARLAEWIRGGAVWPPGRRLSPFELTTPRRAGFDWWSLQAVRRSPLPAVSQGADVATAVDAFVVARLEALGLSLSPPADKAALLRRATFDLLGLPPTPAELDAFLADDAPDAFARVVDRLLASPHYGERWARHWLDVVRFSESKGFERDRIRDDAWRYRDWVITAFNDDLPYDEFVRRQLAGDALAPDDPQGTVPTGMLVTGPNNDVGNGSPLELRRERMDELDDFVSLVGSALLGLTTGCARCHDHKFDPISQDDYYRLAAALGGVHYGQRPMAGATELARRAAELAELERALEPLEAQLAETDRLLAEIAVGSAAAGPSRAAFAPVRARLVRLAIERTADGAEPCLDELELFGPDSQVNLALAEAGARATASSLLPGYAIHQVAHLNDGRYGNEASWISNEPGRGWAQIELPEPALLAEVVWSRDRRGQFADRVAVDYHLEVSLDGRQWETVALAAAPADEAPLRARREALQARRAALVNEREPLAARKAALGELPQTWAVVSKPPDEMFVLARGDVTQPGLAIAPGGLSAVRTLEAEWPLVDPADEPQRRLALARWITAAENPLFARVVVNRIWQQHFGTGLVDTPSDFGFSGGRPSHPELLDWLAAEFVAGGWRIKSLHRTIMLSAAYRQRSAHHAAAAEIDPANRLLWAFPRRRLSAEEIRDAILATSGALDRRLGGPSFREFRYTDGNIPIYEPLARPGPETWRRTVYRHAVRSHSSPLLDVLDCPDSSVMTPRRGQTTTPLQALALINGELVFEQAERMAQRLKHEVGGHPAAQIELACGLVFLRAPTSPELEAMGRFVSQHGLADLCRLLWNANEFLYVD